MPGELSDDHVLVETPAEASALYNRGYFGTPRSGGALELDLLEAVYLVEADRLEVRREGRRVSARDLFRAAGAAVPSFEIRYLVYEESDLTYYGVREAHPRGSQVIGAPKERIVVHFHGDRAVVIDEVEARALHEAGFFGKMVGRRLQLSLLETAFLLKAGTAEVRNADTDRPIRLARLMKEAKAIQPDFDLRLRAYEDLTARGVISKT